jgi:hypothetical protein
MDTFTAILIIFVVLGVVVSNIMLLKYSAKFSFKNVNQDPIEKARKSREKSKKDEQNSNNSH